MSIEADKREYEEFMAKLELEHNIDEIVGHDQAKKDKIYKIIQKEKSKYDFKLIVFTAIITAIACFFTAFCTPLNSSNSLSAVQEQYNSLTVMLNGKEVYHYNGNCKYTLQYNGKHIEVYNDAGTLYEAYSDYYFAIVTEPLETDDNP